LELPEITVAKASREGTLTPNADAAYVHRLGAVTAAAIVDGTGHDPDVVAYAHLAAEVIARISARRGGLAGLLTAAELIAGQESPPSGVAVVALVEPGYDAEIHWIGDCRAYGWNGTALTQYSTDQTMGQWLRIHGVPVDIAEQHNDWIRTDLATATAGTARQVGIADADLILLTSDGVHDYLTHSTLTSLIHEHQHAPQALANALVAAVQPDNTGHRDDATAIVIQHTQP
jgi:serine/threonine protein phosphatase PrpC